MMIVYEGGVFFLNGWIGSRALLGVWRTCMDSDDEE